MSDVCVCVCVCVLLFLLPENQCAVRLQLVAGAANAILALVTAWMRVDEAQVRPCRLLGAFYEIIQESRLTRVQANTFKASADRKTRSTQRPPRCQRRRVVLIQP
jgi:hypothetical protein